MNNLEPEHYIAAIVLIIIAGFSFLITDMVKSEPQYDEGIIVDLAFSKGHTSTTSGVAFNSKGGASPVVGTTSTPDEWIAMVKMNDGEVVKVECKAKHYYGHKVGDNLKFARFYGKWTGIYWTTKSVK